jgi:hypothetical protein
MNQTRIGIKQLHDSDYLKWTQKAGLCEKSLAKETRPLLNLPITCGVESRHTSREQTPGMSK